MPNIDWSHPLTNGLVAAYLPGVSVGINLVGNSVDLTPDTAFNFGSTSDGRAAIATAANTGLYGVATAPQKDFTNGYSLFWRGTPLGVYVGNTNDYIGLDYDSSLTSPFWVAALTNSSGTGPPQIQSIWNNAGTLETGTQTSLTAGNVYSLAGTFLPGGNVLTYGFGLGLTNGLLSTDAFGVGAPSTTSATQISLGTFNSAHSRAPNAGCNAAYMWNRILSASEIAALDADPYGFLIPAEGEMPALTLLDILFAQAWM